MRMCPPGPCRLHVSARTLAASTAEVATSPTATTHLRCHEEPGGQTQLTLEHIVERSVVELQGVVDGQVGEPDGGGSGDAVLHGRADHPNHGVVPRQPRGLRADVPLPGGKHQPRPVLLRRQHSQHVCC